MSDYARPKPISMGRDPTLIIDNSFNYRSLQHMVIMYNFLEQKVYINGVQRARSEVLKGNFSNWDPSCRLLLGNEVQGNRSWRGKIYYVAVYDRPLTEQEIHNHYLSEFQSKINTYPPVLWRNGSTKDTGFKAKGPVVRYLFNEGKENVIHDSGSLLNPLNLYMPKDIRLNFKPFLGVSSDYLKNNSKYSDIIINILIFIPLGIFIHGMIGARYGITLKISLITLLVGTLFSLSIESLQYFSMSRNSSLIDVSTNMTGTAIGIALYRVYNLFLNYQAKRLRMLLYDRKE